jgi:hypothetical protein
MGNTSIMQCPTESVINTKQFLNHQQIGYAGLILTETTDQRCHTPNAIKSIAFLAKNLDPIIKLNIWSYGNTYY